ncbi:hypothetical protein [Collinsella sp. Sow4_E3]|uniref:hypothetical protein n=1 Tax=Collinsella sp. Sow4_E3 TaxID=3438776 RepID=UPI003F93718C
MINTDQLRMQLPEEDFLELEYLHRQLEARHAGNKRRADIYDLKEKWKDLGVAIPQRFRSIEVASGWGQKAVDHLARRVRMESFTFGDPGMDDNFGISAMWEDNSMDVDMPQATTSAFIHSPGFLLTMEGETAAGEPDIVFSAHDALHATGRWNWSRRGLDSALILIDVDDSMYATGVGALNPVRRLIFFNKDRMYDCRRDERDEFDWRWDVERQDYGLGRVPVEPLLYHPRTSRPFGGSRITRSVMYLIQAAMRSMVRAELGAEFFVTPQRYGLNVSEEDLFQNGKSEWDVLIGKMLTLSTPENPDDPDPILNQFPQVSMQPHAELLRFWGTLFSGETGIPVGSLGIIQDNPSSAEAIYAAKEDLVLEAEESARMFTPAIKRTMLNGIQTVSYTHLRAHETSLSISVGVLWV